MTPEASFQDAIRHHQEGRLAEAEAIYRSILDCQPDHAGALHLLGVVRHQRDDHETALELIGRAIALNPAKAVYRNNYGAALYSLGRYSEARECFLRALEIRPRYADGLSNLGMVQAAMAQDEAALASYRKALEIEPRHGEARRKLASLLQRLSRDDEAILLYEKAVGDHPTPTILTDFGDLLHFLGRTQRAIEAYQAALALQPDHATAHFNLGDACQESLRIEEARSHFDRAARLRPDLRLWGLRRIACCPAVFPSSDAMDAYREELEAALDSWQGTAPPSANWSDILAAGVFPGVKFSYHGRNNRRLKEKFAAIYEKYFQNQPAPEGSGERHRRRIGFLVTQRHEGIFLRCMRGIVENLDPGRFEVMVLCSQRIVEPIRKGIRRDDLRIVPLPHSLPEAVRRIREAACDLIYYWEVGTDPMNYFLPYVRLAPVQCTSHGSQVTSGIAAVDYFYSSDLMGTGAAEDHYSERLWRSRTLLMHQSRLPPVAPAVRGQFGLPENRNLYVCLQNPLKLHPDFDVLLGGILASDARALVVLLADRRGNAAALLRERFAKRIPGSADRVVFLAWQKFADYCRLLQLADVILDPLPYGAGSSCYDIFSYNLPMVTLPGEFMPGRVAYAFYREMQIDDLVVGSPAQYVSKAVQVATDHEYREFLRERITQASDKLFDEAEVVREHERFFEESLATADRS